MGICVAVGTMVSEAYNNRAEYDKSLHEARQEIDFKVQKDRAEVDKKLKKRTFIRGQDDKGGASGVFP